MQVEKMYKVLPPYNEFRIDKLTQHDPVIFIDPPDEEEETPDCYDSMVIN